MSDYGSVRQYRARVLRLLGRWRRGEKVHVAAAVACRGCVKGERGCADCEPFMDEWESTMSKMGPPSIRKIRFSSSSKASMVS